MATARESTPVRSATQQPRRGRCSRCHCRRQGRLPCRRPCPAQPPPGYRRVAGADNGLGDLDVLLKHMVRAVDHDGGVAGTECLHGQLVAAAVVEVHHRVPEVRFSGHVHVEVGAVQGIAGGDLLQEGGVLLQVGPNHPPTGRTTCPDAKFSPSCTLSVWMRAATRSPGGEGQNYRDSCPQNSPLPRCGRQYLGRAL